MARIFYCLLAACVLFPFALTEKAFSHNQAVIIPLTSKNAGFTLTYDSVPVCVFIGMSNYLYLKVENTGSKVFKSITLTVIDLDGTVMSYVSSDNLPFHSSSGASCPFLDPTKTGSLNPGQTAYVSSTGLGHPPPLGDTRAYLTMCTEDNLGGNCVTEFVDFVL
jgi:hypothetical protein